MSERKDESADELGEWEHGFVEAYLFLNDVHGEPTHEQFLAALHALERYLDTHDTPEAKAN